MVSFMQTKFCTADFKSAQDMSESDRAVIREAGCILASGGLVAFPTETVYGLGGDALDPEASKKIYAAKGRPSDNPLIVHIADIGALDVLAENIPENARKLAAHFWPGPMTMVLNKKQTVPYETTGGLDTVAVRFPSHPVAQMLIKASGTYIAAPSANSSGRPSPTTAQHVREDLEGKIEMIIDGGRGGIGIESTIVDMTEEMPVILRPGYITKQMLEAVTGPVTIDPAILEDPGTPGVHRRPKAPGMMYRHYAPKGELTVVEGTQEKVTALINRLAAEAKARGKMTAVIAVDETKALYKGDIVESIGTRSREETIAANLYDILRKMDAYGADVIYSESFDGGGLGQAIMNRLLKAAGHHVICADTALFN